MVFTFRISGHDPTNALSYFRITSIATGSDPVINWNPAPGRVYGVLWRNSMNGIFTNISGDIPYPSASYTDTVVRIGSQQFYRIEVRTGP